MPFAVVSQVDTDAWRIRNVRASLAAIRKAPRRELSHGIYEWIVELPKLDHRAWKPGDSVSWRSWTRIVPDDEGATVKANPITRDEARALGNAVDSLRGMMTHDQHEAVVREIGRVVAEFSPDVSRDAFERLARGESKTLRAKNNPEVARKPHASIVSEGNALQMMRQLAQDIIDGGTVKEAKDNAATIAGYCDVLLQQLKSGVHANPSLATFMAGNPMVMMSHHVQAIMYRHKQDNEFYIHTFGGHDVPIREIGGRQVVRLDELPARTGVDMRSDKRIIVLQRPDGKPIADDF